jgi:hypothetical protein
MKALAISVALFMIALGSCVAPAMGQGVTTGYALYVSFFRPFCFLYDIQVTVYDPADRIDGKGFSPDGGIILVPVRTENPTIGFTIIASGYASGPLTSYQASPSYWVVSGHSSVPVEITGGEYWITIPLS